MNLPMIFSKLALCARKSAGTGMVLAKKHAPELMLGAGAISFVKTIVDTVKATTESNEVLEFKDERMELIEQESAENPSYTMDIREMDEKTLKRGVRRDLIRIWWKPATEAVVTLLFFGNAYRIVNGRYVAATFGYKELMEKFSRYRRNVTDEFGSEVDWRMANSMKAEELAAQREAQDKAREAKENLEARRKRPPRTQYQKDINNQIFDAHSSERWKSFWLPSQVIDFIRLVESQIQDKVDMEGSAVLNDAYDLLGMPRTAQGAIVGWIKTPENKHNQPGCFVSLGFANDETPPEEIRRILSSPSNSDIFVWLNPNCDGVIYQMIDIPFHMRGK